MQVLSLMASESHQESFPREYRFPGPEVLQQPTSVDAALPAIYSRRVLIFSIPSDRSRSDIVATLCNALRATTLEFSVLSHYASHASGRWTFLPGEACLHVKELPDLAFTDLKNANFTPGPLKPELLSSVPGMIDFEKEWDCCRIQATFIKGGLLLSVCILHLAMDGRAISQVIQALARNIFEPPVPAPKRSPAAFDRSRLCVSNAVPDIEKLPAYLVSTGAFDFASRTAGAISTRVYRFTEGSLALLKADASSPESPCFSTQDAVCALVFRQMIKARLMSGIVGPGDKIQYSFPVEYRGIIDPPLPPDFIGNAVLFTATKFLSVDHLVGAEGLQLAAREIRQAIRAVDAEYVDNFIAVVQSLTDLRTFNFYGALNSKTTAITSTTYKGLTMPDAWGPVLGQYKGMTLMDKGFGDGMFVIMPPKEVGWDVIITLKSEGMDVFKDADWNRYSARLDA